jgi:hypothetical protein
MEPSDAVSDAEREAAVDHLRSLVRDGRMDLDEFGDLAAGAMSARTVSELLVVMDAAPSSVPITASHRRMDEPLMLSVRAGSLAMTGRWQLARETYVEGGSGKIVLDLTDAEFDARVIDLEVELKSGRILIIVPTAVEVRLLEASGTIKNSLGSNPALPGAPLIRLRAAVRTGVLELRRPKRRRRFLRRRGGGA